MNIAKVIIAILCPVVLSALLYMMSIRTGYKRVAKWKQGIVAGIVLGQASVLATVLGVNISGMFFNVRNAAPICAGLIFGGPAGILAGVIGAAARFMMIFWNQGQYTLIACTLACLIAGLLAAVARKYLFSDRIPPWYSGVILALIVESVHMLLILITHLDDIRPAFVFVSSCMLPMMICTSISVGLTLYVIQILESKISSSRPVKTMGQAMLSWLAVCAAMGFMVTALITFTAESMIGYDDTEIMLEQSLAKAKGDLGLHILDENDEIKLSEHITLGKTGGVYILNEQGEVLAGPFRHPGMGFDLKTVINAGMDTMVKIGDNETGSYYMYTPYGQYYLLAAIPVPEAMSDRNASSYFIILMEFFVYLLMYVIVYFLTKKIMLRGIYSIASSLAEIPGSQEHMLHLDDHASFASMSDDILETTEYVKKYVDDTEGLRSRFVQDARVLEQTMVPSVFPPFPEIQEFDIYSKLQPGIQASGAFYDYFVIPGKKLVVFIGQTSGQGMDAALNAVNAKNRLHDYLRSGQSLTRVLQIMNQKIYEQQRSRHTIALWTGILDLKNGRFEYINCGHNNPIFNLNDKGVRLQDNPGPRLGAEKEPRFTTHKLTLVPGDRFCLFSNGMFQSANTSGVEFGYDRIQEVLHAYKYQSSETSITTLLYEFQEFIGSNKHEQDVAVIDFELKSLIDRDKIFVRLDRDALDKILSFTERRAAELGLDPKLESRTEMVLETLHRYMLDKSGAELHWVKINKDGDRVLITAWDNGPDKMSDRLNAYNAYTNKPSRELGNLNLFLIKRYIELEGMEKDGEHLTHIWVSSEDLDFSDK